MSRLFKIVTPVLALVAILLASGCIAPPATVTVTHTVTTTVTAAAPGAATVTVTKTVTTTTPAPTPAPVKKPYSGITVTVLCHTGVQAPPWYVFGEILKDELGLEVKVVEAPPEEIYTKAMMGIKTKPARYDIIQFDSGWIPEAAPYLLPLDDYIKKEDPCIGDILPPFRMFHCMWAGHYYALTLDGDCLIFYYRADLFENPIERKAFKEKYGYDLPIPPRTWKQVRDLAEFFTRKKGEKLCGQPLQKDFYGYADQLRRGRSYRWYLCYAAPFYAAAKQTSRFDYFDPETMTPLVNSEPFVKALEFMKSMLPYEPPGVFGFEWTELYTAAMEDGVIAMWIHWPDEGDRFADRLAPLPIPDPPKPKLGAAPIPGVIGPDGKLYRFTLIDSCWVLVIPKNSAHPDAAWEVIKFMVSPEVTLIRGMAPTKFTWKGKEYFLKGSNHDPYRYSQIFSPKWRSEKPWVASFLDALYDALCKGYSFPLLKIPGAFEYLDTLDMYIQKYLTGEIPDAKKALDECAAKWNEITKKLGLEAQKEAYKKMWTLVVS